MDYEDTLPPESSEQEISINRFQFLGMHRFF